MSVLSSAKRFRCSAFHVSSVDRPVRQLVRIRSGRARRQVRRLSVRGEQALAGHCVGRRAPRAGEHARSVRWCYAALGHLLGWNDSQRRALRDCVCSADGALTASSRQSFDRISRRSLFGLSAVRVTANSSIGETMTEQQLGDDDGVGTRIRAGRERSEMTVATLARRLGVESRTVSAGKVAAAFHVRIDCSCWQAFST